MKARLLKIGWVVLLVLACAAMFWGSILEQAEWNRISVTDGVPSAS